MTSTVPSKTFTQPCSFIIRQYIFKKLKFNELQLYSFEIRDYKVLVSQFNSETPTVRH